MPPPLIASSLASRSRSRSSSFPRRLSPVRSMFVDERQPLLGPSPSPRPMQDLPWYRRPSPYWIYPFYLIAALARGMTMAPRVHVYTELACHALRTSIVHDKGEVGITFKHAPQIINCLADPSVQALASQIQMIMTITMGVLSACSTGWWGTWGGKHGRTSVLAITTLGLISTDIMFAMVSLPRSPLSGYGHKYLLLGPVVEGLLGGWNTLAATINSYVSDVTHPSSRARTFARFAGVAYVGLAIGPAFAGPLLKLTAEHATTPIFVAAALLAGLNLLFVLFVIPESLDRDEVKRKSAASALLSNEDAETSAGQKVKNSVKSFFAPLATFGPRHTYSRRRKNWSLTLLAMAYTGYLLSLGVLQIKNLYAQHTYSWDSEQLGYFISYLGSIRAIHLLIILPTAVRMFRCPSAMSPESEHLSLPPSPSIPPHSHTHSPSPMPGSSSSSTYSYSGSSTTHAILPTLAPIATLAPALRASIKFDLAIARLSLLADVLSHALVLFLPAHEQMWFVGASGLGCLGGGFVPSVHSLALSILQSMGAEEDAGKVFGGLSILQGVGTTIIGPVLFAWTYSSTVALYPRSIFALAGSLSFLSLLLMLSVRPRTNRRALEERGRGRARRVKALSTSS